MRRPRLVNGACLGVSSWADLRGQSPRADSSLVDRKIEFDIDFRTDKPQRPLCAVEYVRNRRDPQAARRAEERLAVPGN